MVDHDECVVDTYNRRKYGEGLLFATRVGHSKLRRNDETAHWCSVSLVRVVTGAVLSYDLLIVCSVQDSHVPLESKIDSNGVLLIQRWREYRPHGMV